MKRMVVFVTASLCFVGLIGCYTADSGNYTTDQIHCEFSVDVSDTVITATASFWTPGAQPANPTYLALTANDTVTVNGVAMQRKRGPLFDIYTATLQPADEYVFTFTRGDGTSYDSTAHTIATLAVTSPEAGAWVSRAADLEVAWTNPVEGGEVTVFVPGQQYFNGFLRVVPDAGAYTIPAETLVLDAMSPQPEVQTLVSVSRSHKGTMAPGLNGNIVARTEGSVQFVSAE
ncbi:MAG TPA: hypothetical protein ENN29_12110 [Candidatus Hydrogenedentes bacterium]|nr:hypothetical protein [Candidatus Hydrogenedentota bacterium]